MEIRLIVKNKKKRWQRIEADLHLLSIKLMKKRQTICLWHILANGFDIESVFVIKFFVCVFCMT
jgi:hypothetical protein